LKSTAADVLRFLCAFVQDPPAGAAASLQRTLPTSPQEAAIGWMTPTSFDRFLGNREIAWHNGMTPGFASYVAVDPGRKSAIVLLVNRAVDVTIPGTMLMRHVRTQSWAPMEAQAEEQPRFS
jgi:CubicO group peptidase (beta-lactamase class C family)